MEPKRLRLIGFRVICGSRPALNQLAATLSDRRAELTLQRLVFN
ncbi:hypothetical protein QEV83_13880 [Methylocapsa sp. D3K7]|nr:hypothetical protein [Methylocapsa sp. D3K7]WGJ13765.1 hypothetical protein QEV83_13880 [Methylocapsa sp. D3K7]